MDPLSHVLFGRTLIALDRHRCLGPGAVAACALGALAPDVDVVVISRGWDVYLRVHEIGTHSILGSLTVASGAAALVHVVKRGGRYALLMLASSIGALSHLALDVFSGGTLGAGWPLFQGRVNVPLVAMADPWLMAVCITGAVALWIGRSSITPIAMGTVTMMGIVLALKVALLAMAVPQWKSATSSDGVVSHVVEAVWGSLTEWDICDRTPHALRKWRVNAFANAATLSFSVALESESPIVQASKSLDTVKNFLRVHQLGFATTAPTGKGGTRVLWSDIRYCWSGIDAAMARTSSGLRVGCALWFGGTFDREGRPLMQIVHVGQWLQSRPVAP
jgi:membrane-bound metal-dependent hydrolase YbcI (DUF457 family)